MTNGTRRGWGVSVTPRPLFTPGKTRYPFYRRLVGPQGRAGQVRKISPPPGFDPRTVQPVASRYLFIYVCFQLRAAAFKAYCAIWVRFSNFRHQASPRVSPRESTQRRKVELRARNVREFCLNAGFHITCRNLLHAVKLRYGKAC